jgi:hypothetical protein
MAVLQPTEMRDRDPAVLVDLVRIAGRYSSLSGKRKFSNAVGVHLLGVRAVERIWRDFLFRFGGLFSFFNFWFSWWLNFYNGVLTNSGIGVSLFACLIPHLSIVCGRR